MQLFLGLNSFFIGRFESDPSSSESGSGSEQEEKPKVKKEKEKKKKSPEKKRKSAEPSPSKPPKKKAKVAVSPPFLSLLLSRINILSARGKIPRNYLNVWKISATSPTCFFNFFFCLKTSFQKNHNLWNCCPFACEKFSGRFDEKQSPTKKRPARAIFCFVFCMKISFGLYAKRLTSCK